MNQAASTLMNLLGMAILCIALAPVLPVVGLMHFLAKIENEESAPVAPRMARRATNSETEISIGQPIIFACRS